MFRSLRSRLVHEISIFAKRNNWASCGGKLMACRVDITVGLSGQAMLMYINFDAKLGSLFDCVTARFVPEWMTEYRMVFHNESYTRSRAEAMAISDVTQDDSVHVLFVPTLYMEHTAKRGRESKEFGVFASKAALQLPVLLRPSSLAGFRSRHLYELPRYVEVLDAKTLLMTAMQCEATVLRDEYAAQADIHPRGHRYAMHSAHHALYDRSLKKHDAFLGALDGLFLRKKARQSIAAEIERWLSMWRSSEEHSAFQAQLKQLVWDTEALGFFR